MKAKRTDNGIVVKTNLVIICGIMPTFIIRDGSLEYRNKICWEVKGPQLTKGGVNGSVNTQI